MMSVGPIQSEGRVSTSVAIVMFCVAQAAVKAIEDTNAISNVDSSISEVMRTGKSRCASDTRIALRNVEFDQLREETLLATLQLRVDGARAQAGAVVISTCLHELHSH